MRLLIILAALLGLSACTQDRFSNVPQPSGEWTPANADPNSSDNNILPDFAREARS